MEKYDIPLKAGDQIYGVYQSCVQFNEECEHPRYYIRDFVSSRDDFPFYRSDITEMGTSIEYVSDDPTHHPKHDYFGFCAPQLVGFYLDEVNAEAARKAAYISAFKSLRCPVIELVYYTVDEYRMNQPDLEAWAESHNIHLNEDIDQNGKTNVTGQTLERRDPEACLYYLRLLSSLERQHRLEELYELWELSKRHPLAFIKTYEIDRDCYLRSSVSPAALAT